MPIPLGVLAVAGARRPAPTPPAFLTSAKVWLDASDSSTITASGGDVSQWNNKGTLGNFTQATGALQPKTGTDTIGGLNVLTFNGDRLDCASASSEFKFFHDGTTFLIAYVVDWTRISANFGIILSTRQFSSSTIGMFTGNDDRGGTETNDHYVSVSGGVNPDKINVEIITDNYWNAGALIYTALGDADNATAGDRWKYFQNATAGTTLNTKAGTVSTSNPVFSLRIGDQPDGNLLQAQIGEIIIISGADATEANRVEVRDYLNAKWAIY